MRTAAHIMPQRGPLAFWRRPCGVRLFRHWGDCSRIAAACNVTPQAVSQWKRVPTHHVETVSRLLGITPDRLRPDLAQRKLMTASSMDPRDAATAQAQRDERLDQLTAELDAARLVAQQANVRTQSALTRLEEARLTYEQARSEYRAKRAAITRLHRQLRDAGLPIPDFDADPVQPEPSRSLPGSPAGIGGVKTTDQKSVDRTPSKLSPPRNS
ncbi:helix-turn-helix domain-containing protein [Komagataeibacter medellinensis]|uniref:Uncharacterized protein n=1 Tax=Komagataeibacter medellinensis (strain NBRC 3288 / BCRC 11682 / LMG 1693 / Kondo 51) TaxID=634177 RepID=G2I757_KOMMN|nr:helix-turn-helix domain-containing protein [Komagataeibacter medellinensis]BAK83954.1 hypothetical protein GLX_15420 [Komagataeibacter medellinensis NBRC 3288]